MFTLFLWPYGHFLAGLRGARPGLKGRPKRKTLLVMFPSRALVHQKKIGNWNCGKIMELKSVEICLNSTKFGNEDSASNSLMKSFGHSRAGSAGSLDRLKLTLGDSKVPAAQGYFKHPISAFRCKELATSQCHEKVVALGCRFRVT